jgi:hypothetical protein
MCKTLTEDTICSGSCVCDVGQYYNSSLTKCDLLINCPRVTKNETYWNGTDCVLASTYGGSCYNSSQNMCQTLTLGLTCVNNKCDCKDGVWSVTQGKCFNCMSGWILIRKTCYRVSNNFPSGIVFSNLKDRPDIVVSMCYNITTAKIARLNDANVDDIINSNNFVLPYPAYKYNYLYVDNILDPGTKLSSIYWQTGIVNPSSCLIIQNKAVLTHTCEHGSGSYPHPILCEYTII